MKLGDNFGVKTVEGLSVCMHPLQHQGGADGMGNGYAMVLYLMIRLLHFSTSEFTNILLVV